VSGPVASVSGPVASVSGPVASVSGPVALHGGAEFLPGDEPVLRALLELAAARVGAGRPIRVAVVPTAAARSRPERAAANGVDTYRRVAVDLGLDVGAGEVRVIDATSAADTELAARLARADIIHFPGGDPDLIPAILPGSLAWAAIRRAHAAGAALAGSSAGAMALAAWCWTPSGGAPGLGVVVGLLVVPHADEASWADALLRFGNWAPAGLGAIGLGEQTAIITDDVDGPVAEPGLQRVIRWRVVGPGEVRWRAALAAETLVVRAGTTIETGTPGA